jgi:hypothetical protein
MTMTLDVIVPAMRRDTIDRLLRSFSLGTRAPDVISIVSNEVPLQIESYGLNVRLLRFRSSVYPIGDRDLALRRDVGVWSSNCSHLLTFDDDLVAAADTIEASRALLERKRYFWGHHRYIPFATHPVETLSRLPCERGRPREHPPNAWHMWMSCYGGLFGAETGLVREVGGFDLMFSCRQASEDQDFGKRLAHLVDGTERVFVHEPPFAWHPTDPEAWGTPAYTNLCPDGHAPIEATFRDVRVERCGRCPYLRALDDTQFFGDLVLWPYDPDEVEVVVEQPRGPRLGTAVYGGGPG